MVISLGIFYLVGGALSRVVLEKAMRSSGKDFRCQFRHEYYRESVVLSEEGGGRDLYSTRTLTQLHLTSRWG